MVTADAGPAVPRGFDPATGEQLTASDPLAIGDSFTRFDVPSGECWLVQSFMAAFATTAAVAQRRYDVVIGNPDGGWIMYEADSTGSLPANGSGIVCAALAVDDSGPAPVAAAQQNYTLPLPPMVLWPAWNIYLQLAGPIGGQTFTAPSRIVYTRWLSGSTAGDPRAGQPGYRAAIPYYDASDTEG